MDFVVLDTEGNPNLTEFLINHLNVLNFRIRLVVQIKLNFTIHINRFYLKILLYLSRFIII